MNLLFVICCMQDGTVKLWNYRHGKILDDVDCYAYIDSSRDATIDCTVDVDISSCQRSKAVRCLASSRRLLVVSFNGCIISYIAIKS